MRSISSVMLELIIEGGGAGSWMCRISKSFGVAPAKGGVPVSISNNITPNEYRSTWKDRGFRMICSGAM